MQVAAMPTPSARKSATIKNLFFMVVAPWNLSLRRAPTSPESAENAHHFFAVYNVSIGLGAIARRTNGRRWLWNRQLLESFVM